MSKECLYLNDRDHREVVIPIEYICLMEHQVEESNIRILLRDGTICTIEVMHEDDSDLSSDKIFNDIRRHICFNGTSPCLEFSHRCIIVRIHPDM